MNKPHYYCLFVESLEIKTCIGIHDYEKKQSQSLLLTLHMLAEDECDLTQDQLAKVICYETLLKRVKDFIENRPDKGLLETLAGELVHLIFKEERVVAVKIKLEKPDVRTDAASIGIVIHRIREGADVSLCHQTWASHGV